MQSAASAYARPGDDPRNVTEVARRSARYQIIMEACMHFAALGTSEMSWQIGKLEQQPDWSENLHQVDLMLDADFMRNHEL